MIKTMTAEVVHQDIAQMLSNGVSYIDAIVEYAKNQNIEIETVAEIVKKSPVIKEKIRQEAAKAKMIKPDDRRDITELC